MLRERELKTKYRKLFMALMLCILLLATIVVLAACTTPKELKYEVMLPSGTGYDIISEPIVEVARGESAVFEVEILKGYTLFNSNVGTFENNKFTVENVQFSRTVIFDVKKVFINDDTQNNCTVQTFSNHPDGLFFEGEVVDVKITADENYNVDKLFYNGEELQLEFESSTVATSEIIVSDSMELVGHVLGDEYEFAINYNEDMGSINILSSTIKDNTPRYGDVVTFDGIPNSSNIFVSYRVNGERTDNLDTQTVVIKEKTIVSVDFYDENFSQFIYNTNGGQLIEENPIDSSYYEKDEYINIDHCYNKMERDGYSLIGFSEGVSGEVHALGGMVKTAAGENELFAVWKQWTPSANFDFVLNTEVDTYTITGLSSQGQSNDLKEIVIPETYQGKKVVGISTKAFKGNDIIESVYFNKNIVTITDEAFANCANLTNIMLFESTISKHENAFINCPKFTTCEINAITDTDNHSGVHAGLAYQFARIADHDREKMIIIISGSSSSYGLISDIFLEEMPGYDLSVLAVSTELGLQLKMEIISKIVREDDIVILAPEFTKKLYSMDESLDYFSYWYLQKNYDMMKYISINDSPLLFSNLDNNIIRKNPGGTLDLRSTDVYGTYTDHRTLAEDRFNWYDITIDKSFITDTDMALAKKYAKNIVASSGKVYFSFPPILEASLDTDYYNAAYRSEFTIMLDESLNRDTPGLITVISDIDDYFMDIQLCYDSPYHTSTQGAIKRTNQLVKDIKAQLAKEGIE